MKKIITLWIICFIAIIFLWSCGGGSDTATFDTGDGTLSLSLVDAPGGAYQAVYVTIGDVQVCTMQDTCSGDCDCQWETVATLNQTYNLLELVNGVMAGLGQKDLPSGTYNQMRLYLYDVADDALNILDNAHPFAQYLIDENGDAHELKVPSGYQSGIKLVHPFEIVAGQTTELILDFDVARSVVKAGNSGNYLLKPTIKVIGTHSRASVSGVITTDDDPAIPLEGATVTAWHEDADGNMVEAMRTATDASGAYVLFLDLGGDIGLDPKAYIIVATAEGYEPGCTSLTVEVDQTYPDTNFALSETSLVAVTGTLTGTAPLTADDTYPSEAPIITVSFSMEVSGCTLTSVETAFVQVTADDADNTYNSENGHFQYSYAIEIPAGVYDVTASSEGLATQAAEGFNTDDGILDFEFPDAPTAP